MVDSSNHELRAAVTPVKYERDIVQVTSLLVILKKWENNRTEEISLVTPNQNGIYRLFVFFVVWSGHHVGQTTTVRYHYNPVNFLENPYNRHPIARPWGRVMGCPFLVQTLIYIPLASMPCMQCCMKYYVILELVIMVLHCIIGAKCQWSNHYHYNVMPYKCSPLYWPLWWESTCNRWIPLTKVQ